MNLLTIFLALTMLVTSKEGAQYLKLEEAKKIATIDIVKDSLDAWISNWALYCCVPDKIIKSEKTFLNEMFEKGVFLLEYSLYDEDNPSSLYKYLDGGKLYIFVNGKLKKSFYFLYITEYNPQKRAFIDVMEARQFSYSKGNRRQIERLFNTYHPDCFIASGRLNELICIDNNGIVRTCMLPVKTVNCIPKKDSY